MTRKEVEALQVGRSPMGPGSTLKRIQCIRLTRLGASGFYLFYLLPTAYWMFQVISTFSGSALAATARPGPAAYQCVTGTEQVSDSSQDPRGRRGVQRVHAWSTERAVPVGLRRNAAGGARAALIGPDIGKYTIFVYPDILNYQE